MIRFVEDEQTWIIWVKKNRKQNTRRKELKLEKKWKKIEKEENKPFLIIKQTVYEQERIKLRNDKINTR